jgi:hypothetical protein
MVRSEASERGVIQIGKVLDPAPFPLRLQRLVPNVHPIIELRPGVGRSRSRNPLAHRLFLGFATLPQTCPRIDGVHASECQPRPHSSPKVPRHRRARTGQGGMRKLSAGQRPWLHVNDLCVPSGLGFEPECAKNADHRDLQAAEDISLPYVGIRIWLAAGGVGMLHERADAIYTEIVGRPGFVSASHFARLMCDRTGRAPLRCWARPEALSVILPPGRSE